MHPTARIWIDRLELQPHPEGGYFRETYRAAENIPEAALPERFTGPRAFGTAIYYLLTGDDFSSLHRLASDEIWHFYTGAPLDIHMIDAAGRYRKQRLGCNPHEGESLLQVVVEAGNWFGATVADRDAFTLAGCTVAPGFDFADFELARREDLLGLYPAHAELIRTLTRTS